MSDHIKFFSTHRPYQVDDYSKLELMRTEMNSILAYQSKLHQMDHDHHLVACIEEAVGVLDEFLDYDPTPQYAEEPGITMAEMHSGAWVQHQAMHS
jgi:hypothetical protein